MAVSAPIWLLLAHLTAAAWAQGRQMWLERMTPARRALLLNEHNRLRALEPAANMQEMVWDSGLESLAQQRVSLCNAAHSSTGFRSNKHGYGYMGENIWWSTETRLRGNLDSIILEFYKEKPYYNFRTTGCQWGQMCGHYTQVVWHDSCAVGCAISRCSFIANGGFIRAGHILVCHYGKGGNYNRKQPYLLGAKCSRCEGGGGCTASGFCQPTCRAGLRASPTAVRVPAPARPQPSPRRRQPAPPRAVAARRSGGTSAACSANSAMCSAWARIGECAKNPRYMSACCAAVCQASATSPRPAPLRAAPAAPLRAAPAAAPLARKASSGGALTEASRTCLNSHPLCLYWAQRGECGTNPVYMKRFCAGACSPGQCPNAASSRGCRDESASCPAWSRRGECGRSEFMRHMCRRSCRFCSASV